MHGGIFPPGIIRCNETNECNGFVWKNVTTSTLFGFWEKLGVTFIADHVNGVVTDSYPEPKFDGGVHFDSR